MNDTIRIRGARENNLQNVDLTIPRNKLVVFTGLSGSGKTSLAFDTLYAEGQRRYVESLSAYARQFLGQMQKPDVDSIEGLSPAISIDQKTTSRNPRSTVGTVTEIHDYLRLLYARAGTPHCHKCGKEIRQQSVDQMAKQIMAWEPGTRLMVLAPIASGKKGEYVQVFEQLQRDGYVRARVDGEVVDLSEPIKLAKNKKHTIEAVIDRLIIREDIQGRLVNAIETALKLSNGTTVISKEDEDILFSANYACADCGVSMEAPQPRLFSFNSPFGACAHCTGLGQLTVVSPDILVPNKKLSLAEGAIQASGWAGVADGGIAMMYYRALARHYDFDLNAPFEDLTNKVQNILLYGSKGEKIRVEYERGYGAGAFNAPFEGIIPQLNRRYRDTQSEGIREEIESYMQGIACPECSGRRLKPEALAVTVGGMDIAGFSQLPIDKARNFMRELTIDNAQLTIRQQTIAAPILKEVNTRLGFLTDVGLGYLSLNRAAGTLSGGEAQRIRLATQIGSALMGVLYILDEPSIGLHQRDNHRLLRTLEGLRDLGNSLVVVEHDTDTMLAADHIVDVGPGAGVHGGLIVAQGTANEIMANKASVTGQFLRGDRFIPVPTQRRPKDPERQLLIKGARENNLKNIDVAVPLGLFTVVTGVSGSGKSSLVNHILLKALQRELQRAHVVAGDYDCVEGLHNLDKVINIDQSPIGRTPRSNPATYTGAFNIIREVFAATPDAKTRGYGPGRFSFNIKGGRCESCRGDGLIRIEMHFLPDVYVPCEVCGGKRYNSETLQAKWRGKNIAEVLDMRIEEACEFFAPLPRIKRILGTLNEVGLGYMRLGQPSTTLSGGEAQRVKLATELAKRSTGRTLYILDEPTTGLHIADVERLVEILQKLCTGGNTIIVIEHNLEVIKVADWVIDLGPEGGGAGGQVVAQGTPEDVVKCEGSYTGRFLGEVLG
ncbi:MAG: excinuclease ABC subunit UvrA [Clostridia bacterium]|nr:excinuclease ABC subunit UvrA [Clostridia bacterium]